MFVDWSYRDPGWGLAGWFGVSVAGSAPGSAPIFDHLHDFMNKFASPWRRRSLLIFKHAVKTRLIMSASFDIQPIGRFVGQSAAIKRPRVSTLLRIRRLRRECHLWIGTMDSLHQAIIAGFLPRLVYFIAIARCSNNVQKMHTWLATKEQLHKPKSLTDYQHVPEYI